MQFAVAARRAPVGALDEGCSFRVHPIVKRHRPVMPTPEEVRRASILLDELYGSPRHGNPSNPLDVLVYILLSNRTAPEVAQRVYRELKQTFASWSDLSDGAELRAVLAPAGLAEKRTAHLIGIVSRLRADFGEASLNDIRGWSDDVAEDYLCSLPGVSEKVAKCVLLYGCERAVLPVDVHVHRITGRLGWHRHRRADQSHGTLEGLVPPEHRYAFHVNCVAHGRAVCRASRPACEACSLSPQCAFYHANRQENAA